MPTFTVDTTVPVLKYNKNGLYSATWVFQLFGSGAGVGDTLHIGPFVYDRLLAGLDMPEKFDPIKYDVSAFRAANSSDVLSVYGDPLQRNTVLVTETVTTFGSAYVTVGYRTGFRFRCPFDSFRIVYVIGTAKVTDNECLSLTAYFQE